VGQDTIEEVMGLDQQRRLGMVPFTVRGVGILVARGPVLIIIGEAACLCPIWGGGIGTKAQGRPFPGVDNCPLRGLYQ
jgi:hypothetical protein